jgi:hypothetical protein
MELNGKDMKFLTILNETRISDGKMVGRYSDEVSKVFTFSKSELDLAIKKLIRMDMISVLEISGNEKVYFHTKKATVDKLDRRLREIRR